MTTLQIQHCNSVIRKWWLKSGYLKKMLKSLHYISNMLKNKISCPLCQCETVFPSKTKYSLKTK